MAAPWFLQALTVTGPWGSGTAYASGIRGGLAPAYNSMSLVVPDCPVSHRYMRGQSVTVTLAADSASSVLFVGVVGAARRILGGNEPNAVYVEVDGAERTADLDFIGSPRCNEAQGFSGHFNPGGMPNRQPGELAFSRAANAEHWTGESAIRKIAASYMPRATWTITDADLAAVPALQTKLRDYDARGERPLAAICEILSRCGCRLAFRYAGGAPAPVIADADGNGTHTTLWQPARAANAELYELATGYDDRKATPVMIAMSGYYWHETTYSSEGASPLLAVEASDDPDYAWQARIDTANYSAHALGPALPAGSIPHKLAQRLVSRRTGPGIYVTPATATEFPDNGEPVDPRETLAYYDADSAKWIRIAGGARLDLSCRNGVLLRLKKEISLAAAKGKSRKKSVADAAPDIRITLAAEIPVAQYSAEGSDADDPAWAADGLVNCSQYRPSRRRDAILPDAKLNTWTTAAEGENEIYRSRADELDDALAGPYAQRSRPASVVSGWLPFATAEIPLLARLVVADADALADLSGNELITGYSWNLGQVELRFDATDAIDAVEEGLSLAELRKVRRLIQAHSRKGPQA